MPHSSGGGSHGGGHHSGSHHSSSRSHSGSSSSAPSRRISSSSFNGAKRYVYFKNKAPVFVYTNYDITQTNKNKKGERFIVSFMYLIFILFIGLFAIPFAHFPHKMNTSKYNTDIVISDTIGVIEDEDALMQSLKAFQDETGITPAVITVYNEYWDGNYNNLENYSYELYVNAFKDEKHWLIVYSEPENPDPDFKDWKWEGMQGDDTDSILSYKEIEIFNQALHKNLLIKDVTVDQAIANAFDTLTPVAMKKYIPATAIIVIGIIIAILIFFWYISLDLHPKRDKYYSQAVECPETFVDQEACEYCGGIYIVGLNNTCPSCGAPVKPHDFTTDKDGNVTNIIK